MIIDWTSNWLIVTAFSDSFVNSDEQTQQLGILLTGKVTIGMALNGFLAIG